MSPKPDRKARAGHPRIAAAATGLVAMLGACSTGATGDGGRGNGEGLTGFSSGGTSSGSTTQSESDAGSGSGSGSNETGDEGTGSGGTTGPGDGSGSTSGVETGPGTSDPSGGTSGTGSTGDGVGPTSGGNESTSSGGTGGPRFDVGFDGDVPSDPTAGSGSGCAKVDFLFVVDNSGSMEGEQTNLANSFPGFIAAIEDEVQAEDFHIMVVDTDARGFDTDYCGSDCSAGFCPDAPCDAFPPLQTGCDVTLGAGQTKNGAGTECGVAGTARYVVDGQPDLAATFACLGTQGIVGNGAERQMDAMMEAIGPLNGSGECNEGFLRDDAILVVTVITDEEDDSSTPDAWKQALVDAKNGDESAVVVLGLFGDTDVNGGVCEPLNGANGADDSPNLRAFADSFMFGQWGSVCASDYAPFFSEAVAVIDGACDVFTPPG